jgi:hypothetical protein
MAKEKKSAKELADLVMQRIGLSGVIVAVNRDPAYGWHPTVVTTPSQAIAAQSAADQAAEELRPLYDLSDQ